MTITWITNNINQVGGIEQVICGLSNYFVAEKKYAVKIVSINTKESKIFFPLDDAVEIIHCCLHYTEQTKSKLKKLITSLFKELKSDIVITCHPAIGRLAVLSKRHLKGKLIVSEHSDPRSYRKIRVLLNAACFRFADCFVNLTVASKDFYKKYGCNSIVIPNAVYSGASARSALDNKVVVGVGRLEHIKGYDRLISAFAIASKEYPEWKLYLCGDGSERAALEEQAKALGIYDRVIFPGFVKNLSDYYKSADVFALPSRYENFVLTLLDAISCGLPVVAFDMPCISTVFPNGGALVAPQGDVDTFAKHLKTLFSSKEQLTALSDKSYKCSEGFKLPVVGEMWASLFCSLTAKT